MRMLFPDAEIETEDTKSLFKPAVCTSLHLAVGGTPRTAGGAAVEPLRPISEGNGRGRLMYLQSAA